MKLTPYTSEEMREQFMDHLRTTIDYWSRVPETYPEKKNATAKELLEGLTHSILAMIDGCADLPAMDIVLRPHPDDKKYHLSQGERWIKDGTVINGDCHLHELLYKRNTHANQPEIPLPEDRHGIDS